MAKKSESTSYVIRDDDETRWARWRDAAGDQSFADFCREALDRETSRRAGESPTLTRAQRRTLKRAVGAAIDEAEV